MSISKSQSQPNKILTENVLPETIQSTFQPIRDSQKGNEDSVVSLSDELLPYALIVSFSIILAFMLTQFGWNFWLFTLLFSSIGIILTIVLSGNGPRRQKKSNTVKDMITGYKNREIAREKYYEGEGDNKPRTIYGTVLFTDIRAFTKMTESADKIELFRELNSYYDVIDTAIAAFNGTINKFGGDSALALFGAAQRQGDHATSAINAAAAIIDGLAELNQGRLDRGLKPFRVGIGIHSGEMVVGHLGSRRRREYTVIGDCVNVASRLSDMSKTRPFYSIFVGEATMDHVTHFPGSLMIDELDEKHVRGRDGEVKIYAITPLISKKLEEKSQRAIV